jgi:pimeloyl-ACP methyl ester carboxylesterase
MLHFQEPGVAEREFAAMGLRRALVRALYACSGEAPAEARWRPFGPAGSGFFDGTSDPERLPSFIGEADVDVYERAFTASGLTGPLNWYRAMDASWAHMAAFAGARVQPPALFVYGQDDPSMAFQTDAVSKLRHHVPNLRDIVSVPGAGHWVQQERPAAVNDALVRFFAGVDADGRR